MYKMRHLGILVVQLVLAVSLIDFVGAWAPSMRIKSLARLGRDFTNTNQRDSGAMKGYPTTCLRMSDIMGDGDGFTSESEEIAVVAGAGEADVTEDDEEDVEEDQAEDDEDDDLDGLRLGQMFNLLEDDDDDVDGEDDEYGDVEDDEDAEKEYDEHGVALPSKKSRVSLKGRRAARNKAIKVRKDSMTWEDRFSDDPLRAESPTVEIEKPVDPFSTTYVAVGSCAQGGMKKKRTEVWTHHMQWARRNSLLPDKARVDKAFTRLSSDRMSPTGQVVIIKANGGDDVQSLLKSEPIQAHGGVKWDVYEVGTVDKELYGNLTGENPVRDPFVMTGKINTKNNKGELDLQLMRDHFKYHDACDRVIMLGALSNLEKSIGEDGYLIVFSAATKKDALNYLAQDPLVLAGVLSFDEATDVSPANEQDVDGLHHLMARSFAEKAELDPLHYMDPEDLFEVELDPLLVPELNTLVQNRLFLDELKARGMSFRYDRYSYAERYKGFLMDEDAEAFNEYMGLAQKIRLEPAVDAVDSLKKFQRTSEED
jgi:hypothetical protein